MIRIGLELGIAVGRWTDRLARSPKAAHRFAPPTVRAAEGECP